MRTVARVALALALTPLAAAAQESTPLDDRRVATVLAFRAARHERDNAAAARLLAEDARIWFESREGEGRPLDAAGGGPWSEWDRFFRSRSEVLETTTSDTEVRLTVEETNDWYRLVERAPSVYYTTYTFDDAGRIAGVLIHQVPGRERAPDRLPEFEAWAREHRPGLLDVLLSEGRIDPSRPREWQDALLAWRADAGLGEP